MLHWIMNFIQDFYYCRIIDHSFLHIMEYVEETSFSYIGRDIYDEFYRKIFKTPHHVNVVKNKYL